MSYDPQRDVSHDDIDDDTIMELGQYDGRRGHTHIPTSPSLENSNKYEQEDEEAMESKPLAQRNIFKWWSHLKTLIVSIIILVIMIVLIAVSASLFFKQSKCELFEEGVNEYAPIQASSLLTAIKKANPSLVQQIDTLNEQIFPKLYELSELMTEIYMEQVWEHNAKTLQTLKSKFSKTCSGAITELYELNMGPWNRLDNNSYYLHEFVPDLSKFLGVKASHTKPKGAHFYPSNITQEEFEAWTSGLDVTSDEYKAAMGFYHVIRRAEDGNLKAVPYSEEYKEHLEKAVTLINEIVEHLPEEEFASLRKFLISRAQAFTSNNYDESDIAWLDVTDSNSMLEVTLGPYETYEDELFGLKSTFEMFVGIRNAEHSAKVQTITALLPVLSEALPLEPAYKEQSPVGAASAKVVRVVDQIMNGGEARKGVQTAAYNLPNSAHITEQHGSKRVLLRNIQQAKYEKTLLPISSEVIYSLQVPYVQFDAFFTHVLAHELMHGMGPQHVYVPNAYNISIPVRLALQEYHSIIEEAKADAGGLWMLSYILNNNLMSFNFTLTKAGQDLQKKLPLTNSDMTKRSIFVTYLASVFRSIQFEDSHATANAIIFNFLKRRNAVTIEVHTDEEDEQVYSVSANFSIMDTALNALTRILMTIQAEGDKQGAADLIAEYGQITDDFKKLVDQLHLSNYNSEHKTPVDIRIVYGKTFAAKK